MFNNDCLCFFHHLTLCYPECSLGYRYGKVINFNAMELCNGYLDRV